MFVVDKIYVRGVKLIDDLILVRNIGEIIHKDHQRALEEGLKLFGMSLPGRSKTTEQSTARRPADAPSKGLVDGDLTKTGNRQKMYPTTEGYDILSWLLRPVKGKRRMTCSCAGAAAKLGVNR